MGYKNTRFGYFDKRSAKRGGQRIAENTLHLFELCCHWPGALVAQQLGFDLSKSLQPLIW
ncbi:DUF1294 domain-containing protein [Marinobacter flavimaris]|uniref:DUF1294 domain-containing protein n=1 Tax=Marinobacter flavimaris TaxID=262076 RepID=A0A3D8H475_9GAMM|nr:DUF1294 domain-containing protein [Marinobacter sp.]MCP4064376.1 DUF1294 domain-containing protein [Gammaproteobacteria bacterium]PPI80706.1 DUF1294 domain-containing protein [Marinobacter flavimaris]HAS76622.1 DUF1294 domain-containing protein [Marinobacter adhaerens]MBI46500.1 DUF1294 domain-containing protein [Marinobacter sp.]